MSPVRPCTKRDAENALRARKVQIKKNKFFDKKNVCELTFKQLAEEYLAYSKKHKRSHERDGYSIKVLGNFFKNSFLEKSSHQILRAIRSSVKMGN